MERSEPSFELSGRAKTDLEEIWNFARVQSRSEVVATRILDRILGACELVAEQPGVAHRREDLRGSAFRYLSVWSYLLVFNVEREPVLVVRVIHGARNVRRLLG